MAVTARGHPPPFWGKEKSTLNRTAVGVTRPSIPLALRCAERLAEWTPGSSPGVTSGVGLGRE